MAKRSSRPQPGAQPAIGAAGDPGGQSQAKKQRDNTGEWKAGFLAALRMHSNVLKASQAVQVSRVMVYKARKEDTEFAQAWDDAIADALDNIEGIAMDLAQTRSYRHNSLRMFFLKAHKSEVYGDKSAVTLQGSLQHQATVSFDFSKLSNDEFDTLDAIVKKAGASTAGEPAGAGAKKGEDAAA